MSVKFSLLALSLIAASSALANNFDRNVHVPASTMENAADIGFAGHTHHLIYIGPPVYHDENPILAMIGEHGPALAGPAGFHPADIRGAYGDGANGQGAIALVDAYHYPTSLGDFNTFSSTFGLPQETSTSATASTNKVFQVVYATGSQPATDGGWAQEEALDIEWAHSMAPGAKIYLVEAASTSYTDLFNAASLAAGLPGVTQVSMSFGGSEFSGEQTYDSTFLHSGVTFFASSGDTGAVAEYPAESPNVIQVGGTSLTVTNGAYGGESAWSSGGGGVSAVEAKPSYQSALSYTRRAGPDLAAVADPNTGVAVYDSYAYQGYSGWMVFGGTSVASPVCAGIANAGASARGGAESSFIYQHTSLFHDVTRGGTGATRRGYKYPAKVGYDLATGWGSPISTGSL